MRAAPAGPHRAPTAAQRGQQPGPTPPPPPLSAPPPFPALPSATPPRPPLPSSLTAPDRRDPAAARPLLARCSAPHPPALSCRLPSLRLHHSARSPLCRM